jgi:F0F1-type ATP synthase delta subunit
MNPTLPADLHTPDQLSVCIQELRKLVSERRDAAVRTRMKDGSSTPPAIPSLVASLLQINQLTGSTLKELEELVKALETLRMKAPVVHLTLASLPGPKLIAKLVEWFRREVHPQTLLSFVMDRTIGGGVIIRTSSRIYDFSFTSQLLRQKDRLTEIIARV